MSYQHVMWGGHFKKLWFSQILSLIAQNLLNFALIIRVYELTQGTRYANVSVALLILSFGIPSVLFAAIAGVYVDQWDRRRVLIVSNLLRAVLVLGYLLDESNFLWVLALSFLVSTLTQFFSPAEAAAIPKLVRRSHLVAANALFVFTFYATFVIGYSASAPVINIFGTNGPYILTAIFFSIATCLAVFLPALGGGAHDKDITVGDLVSVTRLQLQRSRDLIFSDIHLYFPIIQLMIIQIIISVIMVMAPALSQALFHVQLRDASQYLILPSGLGMVLGVALVGQFTSRFSKLAIISVGLVIVGGGLGLVGLSGLLHRTVGGVPIAEPHQIGLLVAALVFVLGFTNAVVTVTAQTILQEKTTDENRGRVFGALYMMVNLAASAPILIVGVLADLVSVTKVVSAVGAIIFVYALVQNQFVKRYRPTLHRNISTPTNSS